MALHISIQLSFMEVAESEHIEVNHNEILSILETKSTKVTRPDSRSIFMSVNPPDCTILYHLPG